MKTVNANAVANCQKNRDIQFLEAFLPKSKVRNRVNFHGMGTFKEDHVSSLHKVLQEGRSFNFIKCIMGGNAGLFCSS